MHTICKYAPTLYTQLHKPTCEYTTHATTHKPTCNYTLNKQLHAIQPTTHSQHATTHSQQHATTHYTSNYTVYKQLHTANMQLRTANNMQLHTIQATTHYTSNYTQPTTCNYTPANMQLPLQGVPCDDEAIFSMPGCGPPPSGNRGQGCPSHPGC
jgi:hypothetical protein